MRCLPPNGGAKDCQVEMKTIVITRSRAYVDPDPLPNARYAYRIGVSANWVDDVSGGDVLYFSKPVVVPGS